MRAASQAGTRRGAGSRHLTPTTDLSIGQASAQKEPSAPAFHEWRLADDRLWAQLFRTDGDFLVRFPGLADFEIAASGLAATCHPVPGLNEATQSHLFANQIRPLMLGLQGRFVFHGSAVETPLGAIAFLAAAGRGKSTLATSFAVAGRRLLTDDGLLLERTDTGWQIAPDLPSVRLWNDSEAALLGGTLKRAPGVSYTTKGMFLGTDELAFADRPQPVGAAYFLGPGAADGIEIAGIGGGERVANWVGHSFILDIQDPDALAMQFDRVAEIAAGVPSFVLDYPRRYDLLPRVRAQIMAHLSEIGRRRTTLP